MQEPLLSLAGSPTRPSWPHSKRSMHSSLQNSSSSNMASLSMPHPTGEVLKGTNMVQLPRSMLRVAMARRHHLFAGAIRSACSRWVCWQAGTPEVGYILPSPGVRNAGTFCMPGRCQELHMQLGRSELGMAPVLVLWVGRRKGRFGEGGSGLPLPYFPSSLVTTGRMHLLKPIMD